MSDDPTLPNKMPQRPPPPTTKVPRVFSLWGTMCYGISAVTAIVSISLMDFFNWEPPLFFITSAFLYVFISAGLVCLGRIEANKDAKFFIRALKKRSEDNQRETRKMN